MADKRRRRHKAHDVYGIMYPVRRDGPTAIMPAEMRKGEISLIGVITMQWAYLEHMLLFDTAKMADGAGIELPGDATRSSFARRLAAWRQTVLETVKQEPIKKRLLRLASRIANAESTRHKITHGLWQWYPSSPTRLRVYSYRPGFEFNDNVDLDRMWRLARSLGEINHELTYPPRKGLRKIDLAHAYASRRFLLALAGIEPLFPDLPEAAHPGSTPPQFSSQG